MTQPAEADAQPRVTLWMLDLTQPLVPGPVPQVPAVFTRAGPEIAQELAQAMNLDDQTVILRRFARGRHGYIGRITGALVAYGWVTFDEEEIGEVNLSIRLKAGEAYIWHCATLPAHRGQRLYPALLTYIAGKLHDLGLHRVWVGTDNNNRPSQTGTALAGFKPIGDIMISHAFGSRQVWLREHPAVPASLVMSARAALFGEHAEAGSRDQPG